MKGQKFLPLVVVAAGLLAYHNSLTGAFFHDDFGSIPENPTIRRLWPIWQCLSPPHRGGLTVEGRPLINFSLAINYAFGGYNVWGYHALNLTVHILAGLTLLGIVRRTLLQPRLRNRFGAAASELALVTAVLWTVHPLQTESVTYIIQRAESIMGLFYLLTLYCFIRGAEPQPVARSTHDEPRSRLWYGLSVTACVLGMASKEVMASAPLMVLFYDRAFLSNSFREAWRRRWPLYLALAGTWVFLGFVLVSAGSFANSSLNARSIGMTWWQYLATQPRAILHYLRLSVWPHPLTFGPGRTLSRTWMSILPAVGAVVILLAASAWAWRTNSVWGFVGAWFFLILAPTSSFIPLHDPIYEHRMYLPLAAVVSIVVMGLYSVAGRQCLAVFMVAAVGLGYLTWGRNQDYQSNPHYSLGLALGHAGKIREAIGQFEQALQITPEDAWLHYNLGLALHQAGKVQEAIAHYEQALRLKPDFMQAQFDLGQELARLDRVPEAIAHYEQALRINPDYAEAHCSLGLALCQVGQVQEAIAHYEQALRLKPDFIEAHNNLGNVLLQEGRLQEAREHYEQALQIRPDSAETHNNLGNALARQGDVTDAITHYEQALRINPDLADVHYNLGVALTRMGRGSDAIGQLEQALRLRPDYAEAHYSLGIALERAGRLQEAMGEYEEALRLKPRYPQAENRLGRLRMGP